MPARRAAKNHHGRPDEHRPGDPLGVYIPPLYQWESSNGRMYFLAWKHPSLDWSFYIQPEYQSQKRGAAVGYVWAGFYGPRSSDMMRGPEGHPEVRFHGRSMDDVRDKMAAWYSSLASRDIVPSHRTAVRNGRHASTPKGIATLRADKRVREIDDERDTGNGWWLYLRRGWSDDAGAHVIHADTVADLTEHFAFVTPCDCETCAA